MALKGQSLRSQHKEVQDTREEEDKCPSGAPRKVVAEGAGGPPTERDGDV